MYLIDSPFKSLNKPVKQVCCNSALLLSPHVGLQVQSKAKLIIR